MKKIYLAILACTVFAVSFSAPITKKVTANDNEVYFIPTIHQYHKVNQNYNYDSVRAVVRRIDPEIIAVEIRNIDIDEDTVVLSNMYPHEFVMMRNDFPTKKIVGFDWKGADIENIKVSDLPKEYFNNELKGKQWKLLENDSVTKEKVNACMNLKKAKASIMKSASLKQILSKNENEMVKAYYNCLAEQLRGTSYYHSIVEWYEQRDQEILKNIKAIIAKYKGKRIVILTGDDHFQMLKDKFQNKQP